METKDTGAVTAPTDGETPAAPSPASQTSEAAISGFVPATDAVEITGSNLVDSASATEIRAEILTKDYVFVPVDAKITFDPATREFGLVGTLPSVIGPTTPVRFHFIVVSGGAPRELCADAYVSSKVVVITRATSVACKLVDGILSSSLGRALLPAVELDNLAEIGQAVTTAGGATDGALLATLASKYLGALASNLATRRADPETAAGQLSQRAQTADVASLRAEVQAGTYSEVDVATDATTSTTATVIAELAADATTEAGRTVAIAYATLAILATTGEVVSIEALGSSTTDVEELLASALGALGGDETNKSKIVEITKVAQSPLPGPAPEPAPGPAPEPAPGPAPGPAPAPENPADTTPPGAFSISLPVGPNETDRTPSISWAASTDSVSYTVKVRQTNCGGEILHTANGIAATTYDVTITLAFGAYCFEVTAFDAAGNSALATKIITIDARPGTPTGFAAQAGNGNVTLTWNNMGAGIKYMIARRPDNAVNFDPADGTDYEQNDFLDVNANQRQYAGAHIAQSIHADATNGTTYHYAIWAYETETFKLSDTPATASATPAAPLVFHLTYIGDNGDVRYATNSTSNWATQLVAAGSYTASGITVDATNNPHVVMLGSGALDYSKRTDSWSSPEAVISSGIGAHGAIANGGAGIITFLLTDTGAPYKIYSKSGSALTWGGTNEIDTAGTTNPILNPSISTSGAEAHAVWHRPNGANQVIGYSKNSAGWTAPVILDTDQPGATCGQVASPDVTVDAAERPHFVFLCSTGPKLVYKYDPGSSWQTKDIADLAGCTQRPSIASTGATNADIAYSTGAGCDLTFVHLANKVPGPIVTLDDGAGNSQSPQITRDPAGKLHVFYLQSDQAGFSEIRYVNNVSGNWSSPTAVVTGLPAGAVLGQGVGLNGMSSESKTH